MVSCNTKPNWPLDPMDAIYWDVIEKNDDLSIWKHNENTDYAVFYKDKLISYFSNNHRGGDVYDKNGNGIRVSAENRMYKNMRLHDFRNGETYYTLIDYNGDGFIDAKSSSKRYWIYKDGKLIEIRNQNNESQKNIIKTTLDGEQFILNNGKWDSVIK